MKSLIESLKLLGLSLSYFFIISVVIFIANLLLRKFLWAFTEGSIALYIAHNVLCLVALLLGTLLVAPIFKKELAKINHKFFIVASTVWMIAFIAITDYYLVEEIGQKEFIVQVVNSVLIVVFFALLSYNYIIKDLNQK